MAEKKIQTRILNLINTLENWNSDGHILKNGELAIALINTSDGTKPDGKESTPQVLLKVGDGTHTFKELNFVSGLSADVYSWAKSAEKPSYIASEIGGLSDYIAGEIEDTDTQYQIITDTTNLDTAKTVYKLQSKAKNGSWADVTSFSVPTTNGVNTLIDNAIKELNLANTYDTKGSAKAVQDNLDLYKTSNDKAVSDVKATADAAKSTIDAFMKEAVKDGDENQVIDTLKEIQDFISSDKTATSELIAKSHEHTNKATLDKITEDTLTQISTSNEKAHTHLNATELDKFESGDKAKIDTAVQPDDIKDFVTITYVDELAKNYATAEQGAKADSAVQETDFLILQCSLDETTE